MRRLATHGLLAALVCACSPQADPAYDGVALATLRGTVVRSGSLPVPPLDAVLAWEGVAPGTGDPKAHVPRAEVATRASVTGQFPASFTLEIFAPPPSEALFACGGGSSVRMGSSQIEAVAQGVDLADISSLDLYGVAAYSLFYADGDVPKGTRCPGGALGQGYHLMRVQYFAGDCGVPVPDCPGTATYTEIPLATPISLEVRGHSPSPPPPPPPAPDAAHPPREAAP